jgi:hypothetical protein
MTTKKSQVFITNEQINTILNYKPTDTFRCNEVIYNQEVMEVLTSLNPLIPNYNKIPDALYPQNIDYLKTIKHFTKKEGHFVDYSKSFIKRGRYIPHNSNKKDYASLQGCYNIVRRLLCNGNLKGIDICNCHIEIIKNLCMFLNLSNTTLDILNKYCSNREQILNDIILTFQCDRKCAKEFFIIILFGGNFNTWITNCNLLGKENLITDFQNEFIQVFNYIIYEIQKLDVFNGFMSIQKQVQKKTGYDINTSSLAIFLQEIESKIFLVMKNKLEELNCIIRIPIHDAIWYEDTKNITNDELLKILKDEIHNELGMTIPLDFDDVNPTSDDLKWFEEHKKFYLENKLNNKQFYEIENGCDDIGAANHIIKKYNDRFIKCGGFLYVNIDNIWVSSEKDVHDVLHNMVAETDIRYFTGQNDKSVHYNHSKKNINNCIKCILPSDKINVDNDFIKNIIKTTKFYLPFNDGIYSFLDRKLYKYEELPHIKFLLKIKRNFPPFIQEDYDELMNRVLIPIYPDENERNYNAHIKSRAYAGCVEDKKWYGQIGSRDCGKSMETKANQLAFEDFFGEFSTSHLLQKENDYDAKELAWVIPIRNCRVIIANEVDKKRKKSLSINTKLIKSLSSGCDKIEARLLKDNIITFYPSFMMFYYANDGLKVENDDADVFENYEEFSFKSKFVEKDKLKDDCPFLKLKDNSIKSLIEEPRIYNAYLHYILNNFSNPRSKPPDSVKITTENSKGEKGMSVEDFILKHFKTSQNSKDRMHTVDITSILNEKDYNVSVVECGRLMTRYGIGKYTEKCDVNGCRKRGYNNIEYIENTDDN